MKDKMENMKDKVVGKANETWGDLTDDESQELKGKMQQRKAEVKEDFEDAKDNIAGKVNEGLDKHDHDHDHDHHNHK
ncbi:MAG: CsbD family protein [Clostridium sp.]|nr:CsbD family protein [Clostridium sp.]